MTALSQGLHRLHPLVPMRHRYLLVQFVRREIKARYQGSVLGIGWSLVYPLLILAAYTFVFRGIFRTRWPGGGDSTAEFALQVFVGLVVFNLFSELLSRAPNLILEQPNLVKRVVFPLEMLPWIATGTALFHALLALVVLLGAVAWFTGSVPATALLAPLVLACCVPVLLGLGWLFAGLGVFVRDISQVMGAVLSMTLFLSPVLYPASALPERFRHLLWLNPLTVPIESLRAILLNGAMPHWTALAVYTGAGLAFCFLAWMLFERLRPAFADEL